MDAEKLNSTMEKALKSGDKNTVRLAVDEFAAAFHSNAFIINGSEYVLHTAARCFAYVGDKQNAMEFVRLAEWNGYINFREMETDKDLEILWGDAEFREIFSE